MYNPQAVSASSQTTAGTNPARPPRADYSAAANHNELLAKYDMSALLPPAALRGPATAATTAAPSVRDTPAMQACRNKLALIQNVPDELKKTGRWCVWRYEPRPNSPKPAKVPYNPATGQRADVSAPQTFGTYNEAVQVLPNRYDGMGILIADGIVAIDLDNVIDDQGSLAPMAADVVRTMDCYTETSPSGKGIRILFRVAPGFVFDNTRFYVNNQQLGFEVYVAGYTKKYVSVTGNTNMPGASLVDRTQQLTYVLNKYMLRSAPTAPVAPAQPQQLQPPARCPQLLDGQIIQNIRNSRSGPLFDALLNGDMSAYNGDHSAADMGFCNILAAHTKDPDQIDRIFRSSKLMRPKWESARGNTTYGRMTIDKAIQSALMYEYNMQNQASAVAVQQPPKIQPDVPIAASTLMRMNLPEQTAYVEDMFLEGTTTILASSPKCGKSWYAIALGISVATNTKFLGRNTTEAAVLYLALEDGHKRLQKRLKKVLAGASAPDNLYFVNSAPTIADGLFDMLAENLAAHPDIKMIIIDTLALVRTADKAGTFSYSNDYADLRLFKKFSETNHIALVLVHHVRKSRDDTNPFNDISGTNGVAGAVDTMMVLERKRNSPEATLHITGRDVTEASLAIVLDPDTMRWESLGDAEVLRQEREKKAFLDDPLVQTVQELVNESPTYTWRGQALELVNAGKARGRDLGESQAVGYKLKKNASNFQKYLGIDYVSSVNGTSGKHHSFTLMPVHTDNIENSFTI